MIPIRRRPAPDFLTEHRTAMIGMLWEELEMSGHYERIAFDSMEPVINALGHPEVVEPLRATFHGKCAFCEAPILERTEIGHIRPRGNTINFEGGHFPRHYFWLALEWSNLIRVCGPCDQSRGNRFPLIDESQRVVAPDDPRFDQEAMATALLAEGPLLLDPTLDDPRGHLVFDPDSGEVEATSERGAVSIELLNLNRPELVEARQLSIAELEVELDDLEQLTEADVDRLSGDAVPFAAIRRQHIETWAQSHQVDPEIADRMAPMSFDAPVATVEKRTSYSLDTDDYYRQSRKIEHIVLKNFRSIEELTLPMAAGDADQAGWTMILGENGTGKSTMLQGMALALAGDSYRQQLTEARHLDAASFVRRTADGSSLDSGSVEVYLSGVPEPVTLTVEKGSSDFSGTAEARVLLLGYGSTRLLPRDDAEDVSTGTAMARVDNLFDPFVPLANARRWLSELPREEFEPLAASFGELLDLGTDVELTQNREAQRIDVRLYDTVVPMEQLSDGYQSVIALSADIMSVLRERWGSMAVAEGVVLLDELGAHLHPKWRMGIVRTLRKTFPRVQFIVTTHDPLCLRGLRGGEVIVMHRDRDQRVVARTDLPSTEGLRVDQLLTSEHFGLSTTLEPEVARDFDRYYELLAETELDEARSQELERLRRRFDKRELLGSTRRERLMLAAIDRHLAREAGLSDADSRQQSEAKLEKLLDDTLSALEL